MTETPLTKNAAQWRVNLSRRTENAWFLPVFGGGQVISEILVGGLSVNNWLLSRQVSPDTFRSLAPFWNDIKFDKVGIALLKLQRLEVQQEKQFELFGLKIPIETCRYDQRSLKFSDIALHARSPSAVA